MTTEKAIWSVTGRIWNAETKSHSTLHTVDFDRRIDAVNYMKFQRDWIEGLVLDRNQAAHLADQPTASTRA